MTLMALGFLAHTSKYNSRSWSGWNGVALLACTLPIITIGIAHYGLPMASPQSASAQHADTIAVSTINASEPLKYEFRKPTDIDRMINDARTTPMSERFASTPLTKLPGERRGVQQLTLNPNDPMPTFTPPVLPLTSIMTSAGRPIAVVSGALRRVGDVVAPGWSIGAIDADKGIVEIVHETGVEHILRLRQSAELPK